MNIDIWEATARIQTVTALILILLLLVYIAFYKKPQEVSPHSSKK